MIKKKKGVSRDCPQGVDFKSKDPIIVFDLKKQSQKRGMETFFLKFKNKVNTLGAIPQTPFFSQ